MTPRAVTPFDPSGSNDAPQMPGSSPYRSDWFPIDFINVKCVPKTLVKGLKLPEEHKLPICPKDITHKIISELAALTRELAHSYQASSFTTLLTDQGQLFFGMTRNHAHPNCFGHSVECAVGIAVTSGHHSFPLVVTYDKDTELPPFDGLVLERLAEHFVPGCQRQMKLVHVAKFSETVYEHSALLPFSRGGRSRPHATPIPFSAYKKFDLNLTADDLQQLKIQESTLLAMSDELYTLIKNSSADGETRPGRKRHAACVFTAKGDAYFGVNLRADVPGTDRCAEWTALSAALVGGDKGRMAGVLVYSPDYKEGGAVCCCGKCLNSLGDFIDPEIGDMLIVYAMPGSLAPLQLYTQIRNISYGEAEGNSKLKT